MVEESVITSVKKYLTELTQLGVPVNQAILFGSYARKDTQRWSDIDLLIISSRYDRPYTRKDINLLWRTAAHTDSRIEPVPIGLERWKNDDESTIIEIARREGIPIKL